MPLITYITKRFARSTEAIIDQANGIIAEYQEAGYSLTLRQLYYQFVARDLIPNTMQSYNRLGSIINDARLAGKIDWLSIEDRTRRMESTSHWNKPSEILRGAAQQFRIDKWSDQDHYVEVWVEKEALAGIIERCCTELDLGYLACRGYVSQSEMWGAGGRFNKAVAQDRTPIVLHLGDHDPSGIDMTRDIQDRLDIFTGGDVIVTRIALNMDQVREYNPPPNPAKVTDSRFASYQAQFGDESWELDALPPDVIHQLITDEVMKIRVDAKWRRSVSKENEFRKQLTEFAERADNE